MPLTEVFFYSESDGTCPVIEWLQALRQANAKAFSRCLAKLRLLKMQGHELRRPAVDFLRDGIYELRARHGTVQYRLLYFFHGRDIAIVAHALTKEAKVPTADIERALERRSRYEKAPSHHRYPRDIEALQGPP